jgi:hypothetical protein
VKTGEDGRLRIGPFAGVAYMVLTRGLLRRALVLLHCLTREALGRGWEVVPYPQEGWGERAGIAIEIREHRYPAELHEATETLPFTEDEIATWRAWDIEHRANQIPPPQLARTRPTGRLRLLVPNGSTGGRTSWSDGQRGQLEAKIPSIFRTLEARAVADDRGRPVRPKPEHRGDHRRGRRERSPWLRALGRGAACVGRPVGSPASTWWR